MPFFEIEQYELHVQTYRVEAASEAEAIKKLFDGQAGPVDDALEYIQVADKYGMPIDEHRDLIAHSRTFDVAADDDVIPSIRSVRQIG